jgi:hypothetical protein
MAEYQGYEEIEIKPLNPLVKDLIKRLSIQRPPPPGEVTKVTLEEFLAVDEFLRQDRIPLVADLPFVNLLLCGHPISPIYPEV